MNRPYIMNLLRDITALYEQTDVEWAIIEGEVYDLIASEDALHHLLTERTCQTTGIKHLSLCKVEIGVRSATTSAGWVNMPSLLRVLSFIVDAPTLSSSIK